MNNIYNAIQNLYNMDKTTWQEVLAELYNLVSKVENKFDLFELKFGSLLGEQVIKELKKIIDDGSLASLINDVILQDINEKVDSFKTEINEQMDTIANKGTTVEVLERVTKEEINRQIEDGSIANLTIKDNSITWDKFKNELKSNINQLVKNTTINNDGSVKEIFTDNKYKITIFENNVVNEKWYTSDNKLLFAKTTTINPDGSISEALF